MSINFESNYLLLSISDQLFAYQKDRVSQMVRDFIKTNRQMNQFHPVLVKAGKTKAGKQMLKCSSCHKRFVCDHGQLTYYSHQPQSKWNDLIIETQKGNSLLHTAAKINVHESTVFRMRHKYLHFIEDMESDIYGRS